MCFPGAAANDLLFLVALGIGVVRNKGRFVYARIVQSSCDLYRVTSISQSLTCRSQVCISKPGHVCQHEKFNQLVKGSLVCAGSAQNTRPEALPPPPGASRTLPTACSGTSAPSSHITTYQLLQLNYQPCF